MRPRWTTAAKAYVGGLTIVGATILVVGLLDWETNHAGRFGLYMLLGGLAAALTLPLPGLRERVSLGSLFVFLGVAECSFSEVLAIGLGCTLIELFKRTRTRPEPIGAVLETASTVFAIGTAYELVTTLFAQGTVSQLPPLLLVAVVCYSLSHTLALAVATWLAEARPVLRVWKERFVRLFPQYLLGASLAAMIAVGNDYFHWHFTAIAFPTVYIIYRAFADFVVRLDREKKRAGEAASLQLKTVEALALAIDVKDASTHDDLQRIQVYSLALGKELGLSGPELEALRAASILHDIGKLAVPEHILSKPGRLTPEEFEKMKIHSVVGAEILERIGFPYPVVPIVRAHHEKWNGKGYPDGLAGEQIPLGARILSAVDCLDALTSERPYRRALPLDDAMEVVARESGTSYDPTVVELLLERYEVLEAKARSMVHHHLHAPPASREASEIGLSRGCETAGSAPRKGAAEAGGGGFLLSIASARREVQTLYELHQSLGNSLSLEDTLSVLATRLKRILPYEATAIYLRRDGTLIPEHVCGENTKLFASLAIPVGEGLSGWVAENGRPVINGNPSVEPGYLDDPLQFSTLRSALAVPLEGPEAVIGVLTLYRSGKNAFSRDDLRILLAISPKVTFAIENALRFSQAETSAGTDHLTGLPNSRAMFVQLDRELSRAKRQHQRLMVLVCDLDNFKQVNDRLGHLEGNRTLEAVAQGFRRHLREYDYLARMGGDEFVAVLPNPEPDAAVSMAERFSKTAIKASRLVHGIPVGASVGAAFYPDDGDDAEELLAEADRRMYRVKSKRQSGTRMPSDVPAGADAESIVKT